MSRRQPRAAPNLWALRETRETKDVSWEILAFGRFGFGLPPLSGFNRFLNAFHQCLSLFDLCALFVGFRLSLRISYPEGDLAA